MMTGAIPENTVMGDGFMGDRRETGGGTTSPREVM